MRVTVACLVLAIIASLCITNCESTPLDDYVFANDSHFGWEVIKTYNQPDYDLYILNFTSQKWLDGKFYTLLVFMSGCLS